MPSEDVSLWEAVHMAMEAERKAEEYYVGAARRALNPFGHRLLKQLARVEHQHYEQLVILERSLSAFGEFAELVKPAPREPAPSEAGLGPDITTSSALGILTFALEIEQRAEKRYTELADSAGEPAAREMFSRLAAEEHQHYSTLRKAYTNLDEHGVWDWSSVDA